MDNNEIFTKRLRLAKKFKERAEKLKDEYKEGWSTEDFVKKINPMGYKQQLNQMEKNAESLREESVCMNCDKTDIGRLGTIAEMCKPCVMDFVDNFERVTIIKKRGLFQLSSSGEMKKGRCPWCGKNCLTVYQVNIYLCQKCMGKMAHAGS